MRWYKAYPCKKGSELDKDDERHEHFNNEVLWKVYRMFQALKSR